MHFSDCVPHHTGTLTGHFELNANLFEALRKVWQILAYALQVITLHQTLG